MLRRFLVAALGMVILGFSPMTALAEPTTLTLLHADRDFSFLWEEDRFGERIEPHAAILVPVRIEGCPKILYMQFDLGAPTTVLLKNKVASLAERAPGVTVGPDGTVDALTFSMGDVRVEAHTVGVVNVNSDVGIDWDDPDHIDIIGTLGADLLKGRVMVIDYPQNRIFVGGQTPSGLQLGDKARPFVFTPRGVVLTDVLIDNEAKNIMLDTGSSAFALLTDQADWLRKSDGGRDATSFPVNSWGRTLTAHTAATRSVARFGDTTVPLETVSYIEGVSEAQTNAMRAAGMGGMTGNKLFVNKVLVLDAINNTYAVLNGRD